MANQSTLILGLGNIILRDEGFGVHAARRLKQMELPDYVRVEEGAVAGFNLLGCLDGVERLLVIDAMMLNSLPGTLKLFTPGQDIRETGKSLMSFHQVGIMDLVQMWRLLGKEPELYILVARPAALDPGMELSPALQKAADEAALLVQNLCLNNFALRTAEELEC